MMAQIGQVLFTYCRRAISSRFAIVAVIIPVIGIALAVIPLLTGEAKRLSFEKEQSAVMLTWIGMLGFYCPILIAIHFKQQVIQIHQRRIPNAVMAHVIVVVGLLALCSMGLPAALMAIGVWSWGALGLTIALSAVMFAVFALQGLFEQLAFPLILVGLAAALSPVQKWLQELCLGRHEAFGLLFVAAGICGIMATLVRLLQMTEESTGFWNVYDFDLSDLNAFHKASYLSMNSPQCQRSTYNAHARGRLWKTLGWRLTPPEWQVQMWPQWAKGSLWQRVRLRNVGCSDSFPLWLFAAFIYCSFRACT